MEKYTAAVLKAYASTFVRDGIFGRCIRAAANARLIQV